MSDVESRAELLQEMIEGEAWQFVQGYIEGRIAYNTKQLLICDIDQVVKHRAKVEAYNSVLLYVKEQIEAGRSGQS